MTYLSSTSTKHLSKHFSPPDEFLGPQDHASHRCSDAFGQADAHAVETSAVVFQVYPFAYHTIEDAGRVEVHGNWWDALWCWVVADEGRDLLGILQRKYRATESVLQGYDSRRGKVNLRRLVRNTLVDNTSKN